MYLHCLQHSLFEHLFNLYWYLYSRSKTGDPPLMGTLSQKGWLYNYWGEFWEWLCSQLIINIFKFISKKVFLICWFVQFLNMLDKYWFSCMCAQMKAFCLDNWYIMLTDNSRCIFLLTDIAYVFGFRPAHYCPIIFHVQFLQCITILFLS